MKKMKIGYAAFIILVACTAFTAANSNNWKVTEGYSIKFTSKDPSGVFTKFKGDIAFDENNLNASKFDVAVDASSINTGNGMKNKKAKGEKFFDVENYPEIKFVSNKFSKTATGYEVRGTLDMHGVKKEVTIPFTFVNNTFTGSFVVNRLDYNIGPEKGMAGHAGKELTIDISVPVTKQL
jgi:polyisoprenoid-binding protein YceI